MRAAPRHLNGAPCVLAEIERILATIDVEQPSPCVIDSDPDVYLKAARPRLASVAANAPRS